MADYLSQNERRELQRQTRRYHGHASETPPHGFRSAVAYDAATKTWITVGPNGTDISTDDGRNWRALHPDPALHEAPDADRNWNALSLPFVVGPHGRIGKLNPKALAQAAHYGESGSGDPDDSRTVRRSPDRLISLLKTNPEWLWNAMRVGAALYAVSMAAGASVLMPYLSLIWSIVAQQARAALLFFEAVEERQRVQAVGNEVVQLHADEIRVLVLRA